MPHRKSESHLNGILCDMSTMMMPMQRENLFISHEKRFDAFTGFTVDAMQFGFMTENSFCVCKRLTSHLPKCSRTKSETHSMTSLDERFVPKLFM